MDRDVLLNTIRKYLFYSVELNLYLDNFPDCNEAKEDLKKTSKKLKDLICEYETNYGQLQNFGFSNNINPDSWDNDPWPWEQQRKRGCCR